MTEPARIRGSAVEIERDALGGDGGGAGGDGDGTATWMDDPRLARLRAWDLAHVWHPFTPLDLWESREPLVIERGSGAYLYDARGRRYLDGVSSLWCNVHGHAHPRLDAAIRGQLDRVAHTTLLGATHPPAIELARRLAELAPAGLTRVFFSDNGSTAVESAMKIAFQYWRNKDRPEPGRTRIAALGSAYHGDTLGDVSVGGIDLFHATYGPMLFPALRLPSPFPYRDPENRGPEECRDAALAEADRILSARRGEVAAVVAESLVQGAAGMIVHPPGFLRGLRELCDKHDTLLICDEVATGFGRTGTLFACEREGVVPDLLCLAKGLTAGYLPLAATLVKEGIHEAFRGTPENPKTFYHGHTFSGNPLAAAVAIENLNLFEEERTLERLSETIPRLHRRLEDFRELRHTGDVRALGLMGGVELVEDVATKRSFPAARRVGARVCHRARDFGLLARPLGDVLVLMPPLCATPEQIDEMVDVLLRCAREVTEEA